MSESVAAVTRAAKVEAFSSWSAWRMSETSRASTNSESGTLPVRPYRKL
jgi:hypothetical protein